MIGLLMGSIFLFCPLFVLRGIGPLDFWWWMSLNLVLLISAAAKIDPSFRGSIMTDLRGGISKKIALGVLAAAALYSVFFFGNTISRKLFPFATPDITAIYELKAGVAPVRVWILMTLVLGPGEELFWRGYLQRALTRRIGQWPGYILASMVYTGVHLASGNILLVVAALICESFWGWLYLRSGSILLNAVSHTVWDVSVFLLWPLE